MDFNFDYAVDSPPLDPELLKHVTFVRSTCSFVKTDGWQDLLSDEFKAAHPNIGNYQEAHKQLQADKDWKSVFMLNNAIESINGAIQKDGSIKAHVSGPGEYQFSFHVCGKPGSVEADSQVCTAVSHQQVLKIEEGVHSLPPLEVDFTPPPAIGQAMGEFEIEVEETKVTSAELAGKVVLLDFWIGTSKHTGSGNKSIAKLKSSVQVDDPLAILSFNCLPNDRAKYKREFPEELTPFVRSLALDYDTCAKVNPRFGAWNVPLAVVIDQKGKLVFSGTHDKAVEVVQGLIGR